MRLFYNILQLLLSPLLVLVLPYIYFTRKEQWQTLCPRLGRGLTSYPTSDKKGPVVWIHALSVGETTSAIPLIHGLISRYPETCIVFSATTSSGRKLAEDKISALADIIIPFPLDISFIVKKFIKHIQPDLFILVETDFWPNVLGCLRDMNIPTILVNGRISKTSMNRYRRFSFFFKPMFNTFTELCMQTQTDADNMLQLGISREKVKTLGNLKYQSSPATTLKTTLPFTVPVKNLLLLCGSTHAGEEEILFEAYRELRSQNHQLTLAIAPRHPSRTAEIISLADTFGFSTRRYSDAPDSLEDVLLVDTIGDLAGLYRASDIAFIGGSLVPEGGHNPLEAASFGIPTIFGPFMDDFDEISRELVENRAAFQVSDKKGLLNVLVKLIDSDQFRKSSGTHAAHYMDHYRNVVPTHLELINNYL
ncbi:MAG: 3-deoxy-D-manno-octulosonic acid transferase [Desulfocapsaceae bacterium]|jgi:3-deoxy-D-manno-octulosonic-acid transferase|nr:3-deoxy-D-manno-octulosonic acid transferase [Desulfocapsaceae bacterium]